MNFTLLGKILKEERKMHYYSQKEIAQILEINQSTICRLEKGESNKIDLYNTYFDFFDVQLFGKSNNMRQYLDSIYESMEFNHKDRVEALYQEINGMQLLNYEDHYIKKIIESLYYLYQKDFVKLILKVDYISHFTFLYDDGLKKYYHLVKGYYHHVNKNYHLADGEFKKILSYLPKGHNSDNIFSYIYAWNHIILGNFSVAQIFIKKSKINSKNKQNNIHLVHLNRLLSYIYFLSSDYKECIKSAKKFFVQSVSILTSKKINTTVKFIMASSFILLKQEDEAIKYLKLIINHREEEYFEIYYSYLLVYLIRSNNEEYSYYYQQIKQDPIYQDHVKRNLIESFISDGTDSELFLYKFDYIIKKTANNLFDQRIHVKLLFSVFKYSLWKKRKYYIYKTLNTHIFEKNTGEINDDL